MGTRVGKGSFRPKLFCPVGDCIRRRKLARLTLVLGKSYGALVGPSTMATDDTASLAEELTP